MHQYNNTLGSQAVFRVSYVSYDDEISFLIKMLKHTLMIKIQNGIEHRERHLLCARPDRTEPNRTGPRRARSVLRCLVVVGRPRALFGVEKLKKGTLQHQQQQ